MKLSNPLKSAILTILSGAIILFAVIYVERKTIAVDRENRPLVALAEHVKSEAEKAHTWFEKVMKRDKSLVLGKGMYTSLDTTIKLFTQVLDGGETELGVFHKTTNIEIINTINQLILNSVDIKNLAEQRMNFSNQERLKKEKSIAGLNTSAAQIDEVGGALDQAFDAAYEKLQGNFESLDTLIKMKIAQDGIVLNNLFWASVWIIIFVFVVFSFLLYKILKSENSSKRALSLSEEHFRTIFEKAPLGIALVDSKTGVIFDANSKYSEITNRSLEELKKTNWMDITHPDDLKEGLAFNSQMNGNKLTDFCASKRYIRPDKSSVFVNVSVSTFETENKLNRVHIAMVEDVTAIKKNESEYLKKKNDLENAQELAQIGSWEFNLITSELIWSKELYRIFELENCPANDLYQSYKNKFHPDDLIKLENAISNSIENGEGDRFEHRILCNGGIKYLSCIIETIKNEEEKVIGLKGTCQNITNSKNIEKLLKNSIQYDLLVSHASQVPGALYQFQISLDGKFLFPFVSDGILELCEISPKELMQDSGKLFNAIHKDDLEGLLSSFKVPRGTLENWKYEFRMILPTKGTRWLRGNSKPEKLEDGSIIWHGYLTDITESKLAKDALQTSKDKQEAIFNGSNDAIMLLNKKGFFDCNPKTLKMFGMSDIKEFIESHPSDLSPAFQPDGQDSLNKANEMIEIAYEKGGNRFEWVHQRKNGECFSAEVLLSAFNYGGERVLQATVTDITKRKQVEKLLDEQKAFYEKILNTLPIEIAVFDAEHKYLFLNPASVKKDDFREFIIGKDDFEYCEFRKRDKSVAQERRNQFLKVKEQRKAIQWEDTLIDEHGKTFSNLRGMLPIFNEEDELTKVIGFGLDITERKMAEKKLIENEALLASILEALPVAVFCKDIKHDFKYTVWNKKAEEIFGVNSIECIGKDDFAIFPKEHAASYRNDDIEASKTSGIIDVPEEIVESENKKVLVHTKKSIIRDIKGNPNFLLGVSEDITEQKIADEKIKKSEEKYRSVVENAADMIITFDTNSIITFINHLRPGTKIEQVIGASIYELIPVEYQDYVKQKIKKVFDDKTPQSYELPGQHIDGSSAWYSANLGPLFTGEEVTGITLILRDVTENKQAEIEIQQSLKEKEVLLKEVHHRVKNNLQIILSILNLQYANIKDKKTLGLVRDIRSRIKAMSFIHELLYQTNDFSTINFSEYITSITNNLVYSYTQSQTVNLKLDIGTVFLDLDQAIPCGLIINEIVTNALKYAFTSQKNAEVSVSLIQKNDFIELIISDNGKGFPDTIDFRNTESLGMQLVVTLVQQLNGEISLDNSNGTIFTIGFKMINKTELLAIQKQKTELAVKEA